MGPVLILLLVAAMGAVVFAVIKGLHAFANLEPDKVDEKGVPLSLGIQNKAMYARVKWQAIAIALVAALLLLSQAA